MNSILGKYFHKMEFKIELISKVHPSIWTVECDEFTDVVQIVHSPFGNCQTFSLMQAKQIRWLDKRDVKILLKELYKTTEKTQFVIDLQYEIVEEIIAKLSPFCFEIKKMEYESTNRSSMVLCLVQINKNEIK